jgi:dTDP-4-dehydrorhamnose reductase
MTNFSHHATDKPLVWVTGAGGLIGSNLLRTAPLHAPQHTVRGLLRDELDLTNFKQVRSLFQAERPTLIIHCAAISRSPECQQHPEKARLVNIETTRWLTELDAAVPLLFFSTDLVFDGRQGRYREEDPVHPLSVYAETKAVAEQIVLANPRNIVIRTSLNGGSSPTGDRGFNEELRRAWQLGRRLSLFTDEFRCPIPAVETARAIWLLIQQPVGGIYHLAGSERLSRWEIGQLLAVRWPQLNPQIEPVSLVTYTGPTRPPDTSLDCSKIQGLLPYPLPGLKSWIESHAQIEF